MGKGDKDSRCSSYETRRKNYDDIRGFNFKPYWMKNKETKNGSRPHIHNDKEKMP
jgi:hypothetical protein